ncbi:MAG: hypothetical protein BMS9Abin05_1316 [Rhodothermia bacterium]|nr:MAG: hypothetical protein BMS9Abin05_1316 [Rhodothermia bacterium]
MYTSFIGSRVALSMFFTVALVFSAAAQQIIGNDVIGDISNELSFDTGSFENLSEVVSDLQEIEYLPIKLPALTSLEWSEYGTRLEVALASGHRGLQNSALRLIIAYGENFDLDESAVFNVMRLYRDGDSTRIRRMAVVALAQIDSEWVMKFLERSVRFEKSDQVRHTILAVLNKRGARKMST